MAAARLDDERAAIYRDLVLGGLQEAARRALDAMLLNGKYELQSAFARKHWRLGVAEGKAEGKAEALLLVLQVRGIALDSASRERVLACADGAKLETWIARAAQAHTAADVFGLTEA